MKVLRFPQLRSEKGIDYSRTHVDRLEKDGCFPKRVSLGPRSIAWVETEVDEWLTGKVEAR